MLSLLGQRPGPLRPPRRGTAARATRGCTGAASCGRRSLGRAERLYVLRFRSWTTTRDAALQTPGRDPARRAAYVVLRRVFEQGAYADRALHGEAAAASTPRDRAFAMRLAYGTVQRRGTLDHVIERSPAGRRASTRPCSRRCGSASTSCSSSTASPTTPPSARRVELAKPTRPAAPGSSTRSCAAPPRGRRRVAGCPTTRPSRRRSATRIPSGSRGCGGTRSAPRARAR